MLTCVSRLHSARLSSRPSETYGWPPGGSVNGNEAMWGQWRAVPGINMDPSLTLWYRHCKRCFFFFFSFPMPDEFGNRFLIIRKKTDLLIHRERLCIGYIPGRMFFVMFFTFLSCKWLLSCGVHTHKHTHTHLRWVRFAPLLHSVSLSGVQV